MEIRETSFFLQIVDLNGRILITSENMKNFGEIPFDIKSPLDDYSFHNINPLLGQIEGKAITRFVNSEGKVVAFTCSFDVFKSWNQRSFE
ncbi:MAG: hypothetical protein MZV64_32225 [Ignavibacteriales bacterium]|nr:hypothetical protein [Ignavibacteriales bacterium]